MINLFILLGAYFVSFTDKPTNTSVALSPRAQEQRTQWNIPTDDLDYPVCSAYVDSISRMGATLCHTTRWFNGATFTMSDSLAIQVTMLPFVKRVEMTRNNYSSQYSIAKRLRERSEESSILTKNNSYVTDDQLRLYNLLPLLEAGYSGQGIVMAVCDGGFYNANTLSCFRQSELELGHFDFTDDIDDFYGSTGTHGTACLSTISGLTETYRGAATMAQYYLMRSEENDTESPKEMDNIVAALEKADSLGVNVFSASLGYAEFDNSTWTLPYSALDGNTTRASRAAHIAARKGMLVCIAAGNEGNSNWHMIGVPADADSILAVGAVTEGGVIAGFSSYGPSADGRIKPEVCAMGVQTHLIYPEGMEKCSNGTSFATPLIAGLAASLWSALPGENAMQIRERIIRSADRHTEPDKDQYGYGIPNAWAAYTMDLLSTQASANQEHIGSQKILRNGRILILRNGQVYDMTGNRIE